VPGYSHSPLRGWFVVTPTMMGCVKLPNYKLPNYKLPDAEAQSELFYSGALERIRKFMLVLAPLGVVCCLLFWSTLAALGFAVGAAIAYLNFYWLKRVVAALAERVTSSGQAESGRPVFTRFLLRYALIAVAGYAIFRVSVASLYGLFAGLFLPVGAIACEAAYEAYTALRRGL
jgi:hypothetical protein